MRHRILDGLQYAAGDTVPVTAIIAYIRQADETLEDVRRENVKRENVKREA